MNKMKIDIIKGSEGYCLNLVDETGSGERILGSKPWGNPYNNPTFSFEVGKGDLIMLRNTFDYYANKME